MLLIFKIEEVREMVTPATDIIALTSDLAISYEVASVCCHSYQQNLSVLLFYLSAFPELCSQHLFKQN